MGKLASLIERIFMGKGKEISSEPELEANYEITFSVTDEDIGECGEINDKYIFVKGTVYRIDEKGNPKMAGTSREDMIRRGEEMIGERFEKGETPKTLTLESYMDRTPGFVNVKN